jgi:hypothetical protein
LLISERGGKSASVGPPPSRYQPNWRMNTRLARKRIIDISWGALRLKRIIRTDDFMWWLTVFLTNS